MINNWNKIRNNTEKYVFIIQKKIGMYLFERYCRINFKQYIKIINNSLNKNNEKSIIKEQYFYPDFSSYYGINNRFKTGGTQRLTY